MAMAKARPRVSGLRREGHRPRARVPAPPSSCDNRRPVRAVVASCLLTLAGCATMSKEACLQGDWAGVGFKDGEAGRAQSRLDDHAKPILDKMRHLSRRRR
jgi:hypothetical protein